MDWVVQGSYMPFAESVAFSTLAAGEAQDTLWMYWAAKCSLEFPGFQTIVAGQARQVSIHQVAESSCV